MMVKKAGCVNVANDLNLEVGGASGAFWACTNAVELTLAILCINNFTEQSADDFANSNPVKIWTALSLMFSLVALLPAITVYVIEHNKEKHSALRETSRYKATAHINTFNLDVFGSAGALWFCCHAGIDELIKLGLYVANNAEAQGFYESKIQPILQLIGIIAAIGGFILGAVATYGIEKQTTSKPKRFILNAHRFVTRVLGAPGVPWFNAYVAGRTIVAMIAQLSDLGSEFNATNSTDGIDPLAENGWKAGALLASVVMLIIASFVHCSTSRASQNREDAGAPLMNPMDNA